MQPQEREAELTRVRASYAARDASPKASWEWSPLNPAAVSVRHQREMALIRLIREAHLELSSLRVADFGCGGGEFASWLVSLGVDPEGVFGVDLSEERVAAAAERVPGARFVAASADTTDLPDASVDIACQLTLMSSVHDASMRAAIAAEMDRVVVPGGHILWFDVRPLGLVLRSIVFARRLVWWLLRGVRSGAAFPHDDGALVMLSRSDIAALFPGYAVAGGPACVSREAIRVRGRFSQLIAAKLDLFPSLRANLALLLTKPRGDR